ncbi:MAG: class I SAM-dependent rRNA methyltransferase [Halobacteria archaeon]|nr:class I SAM-dependent rRNA methyltransferase [Halobacteria archaeon]
MTGTQLAAVILRKNRDRRLRAGHLWVYSNEVDTRKTPLSGFEPGDTVVVQTSTGKPIGTGYINPHSLICARLLTRRTPAVFDTEFFSRRIETALALRAALYETPHYRLVYAEGDDLPGLVVDRYAEVLVVQITTAGMERCRAAILEALQQVVKPRGILLRNDSPVRRLERLELDTGTIGTVPGRVTLEEGTTHFEVPLGTGQKTGWFFDQRNNRLAMHKYVKGRRVLDLFSYIGAWGVQAARAGATEVCCVDVSALAQEVLANNAAANGVSEIVRVESGDAFEVLKAMRAERRRFDVVIVDPPAFIKRRKDIRNGEQAYSRLNQQAMQLLESGGFLISSSCSMHLAAERLQQILQQSAHHLGLRLQVVERGFQAMDHPVHPAIPETAYLKTLFCRLLPA